ncbi:MAG: glycerol-3-phosphate 1-O-acyltransferase [Gemmatimonadales bacterium]|nr:MAG: glycerol-3-phosphate 1-O-acyltransferase [Gemmatimonadales bacterium]
MALRSFLRRAALSSLHRFGVRLERFKLASRAAVKAQLLDDPKVKAAIAQHCETQKIEPRKARRTAERYIDEMVPFFKILAYYRAGYSVARRALRLLYRVSAEYQDRAALAAIPRQDVTVYLMNHRSNADYVLVAFVLARAVSISYAVGEWARIWPLEYLFKSFGAYFIRRGFREPLYHTILERYVQLVTKNGVTQGIFLEGKLSRDGTLGPPKLGLLDYIARTLLEADFRRDIWIVPVALNYDRVLEDRTLVAEWLGTRPPGKLRQAAAAGRYLAANLLPPARRKSERYGRAAICFGTPLSLRAWTGQQPGVLELPKTERLAAIEKLAQDIMRRIAEIMPVTAVPLEAAALLSFGRPRVSFQELVDRLAAYCSHLRASGARLLPLEHGPQDICRRAGRLLKQRRLVEEAGGWLEIPPSARPLLQFYANSITHLLPRELR